MITRPSYLEATATTTPRKFPFVARKKIFFVTNDSETNDLIINFDRSVYESGAETKKPMEIDSDFEMECFYIEVMAKSGTVPFRIKGV